MNIIEYIGYIPAVVFPTATLLQLRHLLRAQSAEGLSLAAWAALMTGNLSMYIYTEKYTELQTIFGMLLTSCLQLCIVLLIIKYRRKAARAKAKTG